MLQYNSDKPAIFIDQRKARIRIYRRTLRMLGFPPFIQLLVNPDNLTIAIRPAGQTNALAHRIVWKRLNTRQSYELYSGVLLQKLQEICCDWEEGKSYRLFGEFLSSEKIALFDLNAAIGIPAGQEIGNG